MTTALSSVCGIKGVRRVGARGFTLIELLVTIAVMVLLLAVGVPSFQEAYLNTRLTGYANAFVASVQLARSEAIKRNGAVTLCRSSDGTTCATTGGWQQGWVILGIAASGNTVIQRQEAMATGYQMTGGAYSLSFEALGGSVTTASLILCRSQPSVGNQERVIAVTASGRTSVTRTTNGVCS